MVCAAVAVLSFALLEHKAYFLHWGLGNPQLSRRLRGNFSCWGTLVRSIGLGRP
jgi:hypothetical protein